ncbi:MAG: superoxide dismutase [Woeseiaceae bacterium]|nr:superoxide dismutase [Woeseiaceae bacterium]
MAHQLPNLPYDMDALEPHVSADTMSYHYDKHHRGYVDKLNTLIDGTGYESLPLERIIANARDRAEIDVLNNAAQAWNHEFLWKSMSPNGGGDPDGALKQLLDGAFKNTDGFKAEFRQAALSQFGSGWTWLVLDNGRPKVMNTTNADSPVGTHLIPLLTLDVWEHAYYLDYQNERAKYVDSFLDNLVNWDFAAANLNIERDRKAA